MKPLSLLFLSLAWLAPSAHADLAEQIVKTRSGDCQSNLNARMYGSGLAFREGKEVYVITSEHIALQSRSSGSCHDIWIGHEWKKADLVRADWASGLGLFRLAEAPEIEVGALPPADASANALMITGFPAGDRQRIMDRSGKVLARDSGRGLFARQLPLLEIDGAHGEFGMSGAPVLDLDETRWAGILSHQVVMIVPGRPSVVGVREPGAQLNNTMLVIAAPAVKQWIDETLRSSANELWTQDAHRDAAAQLRREEVILFPGLRIRPTRAMPTEELQAVALASRGDGVGTGGRGDGVGTGGRGDGVGTGGGNAEALLRDIRIAVELSPTVEGRDRALSPGLERARARAAIAPLTVSSLLCPLKDDASLTQACYFDSVVLFLRMLETPNVSIPLPKKPAAPSDLAKGARDALNELHKQLKEETQSPSVTRARTEDVRQAAGLIARIEIYLDNLEDGKHASRKWIEETLNGKSFETAWQVLFELDFESALTLQKVLRKEQS